jgi:phosphohistidine phosphatase
MKTLLLMRHARTSTETGPLRDHDRLLDMAGEADAQRVGHLLVRESLVPDHIMCSSANRSWRTADIVAEAMGYTGEIQAEHLLYLAEPRGYLAMLGLLEAEIERVLVVGHNPGLEDFVYRLTRQVEALQTSNLIVIELPIDTWSEIGPFTRGQLINVWRVFPS